MRQTPARISLALVHHANQLIITNGYDNRDGISKICAGYLDVLEMHRKYGVPVSLHLSGTLVEAMLWHEPAGLRRIRELAARGALGLLGGTYSEPIMPTLSAEMNHRQLTLMREILCAQFPDSASAVRSAWLPERVWSPEVHGILADTALPGGPYDRVLVDDRLLARTGRQDTSAEVDACGPSTWSDIDRPPSYRPEMVDPKLLRPRRVEVDGRSLTMVPISTHLRYLLPPRSKRQLEFLRAMLADLARRAGDQPQLLVFADDLERSAGVGGWEPALAAYERLLMWLSANDDVEVVDMDVWLDEHAAEPGEPVAAGSYRELEVDWRAGAHYDGWTRDAEWAPYARMLAEAERDVTQARGRKPSADVGAASGVGVDADTPGAATGLVTIAERLLLLGQHETAWHDPIEGCVDGSVRHIAPWVRATASHARLVKPLLMADAWALAPPEVPTAVFTDVDDDGEPELVLAHQGLWCLVIPRHGARLTMMVRKGARDAQLVVGNPADHWNFQEQLHRYMDVPAAHPGALASAVDPHESWTVSEVTHHGATAAVVDLRPNSGEANRSRRYALVSGIPALVACVQSPLAGESLDCFLTPDYLAALAGGTRASERGGRWHRSWRQGECASWIGFDPLQATIDVDRRVVSGHGHLARVCPSGGHVDLLIGAGPVDDGHVRAWLTQAGALLHPSPGLPLRAYDEQSDDDPLSVSGLS